MLESSRWGRLRRRLFRSSQMVCIDFYEGYKPERPQYQWFGSSSIRRSLAETRVMFVAASMRSWLLTRKR